MPSRFADRLLSVLQLTRMALVFTAIADSLAAMLLWASRSALETLNKPWISRSGLLGESHYLGYLTTRRIVAVALVSIGLYGFGMSLNDIIDRRRDRQIAAHRPLPSGRIGLFSAHLICIMLALTALIAGAELARYPSTGALGLILLLWTAVLITFYDFAGKYLVAPGLLTLGLIRFFHATIAAPRLPMLWHPLLLLNHVVILSAVAYTWEQKRPTLTRLHWWAVFGGLAVVDVTCIMLVWLRREAQYGTNMIDSLWITPGLIFPGIAVLGFLIVAELIWLRSTDIRAAGRNLMMTGLLWLIVYDAAFVAGYVDWRAALLLLSLLPIAYLSVQIMRWWAKIILLSQRPEYQRAR